VSDVQIAPEIPGNCVRSHGAPLLHLADVAVVISTVLRPTLARAVESVFNQDFAGRIHLLIGVDVALGERSALDELCRRCPENIHITVFDPGYSTAARHGGPQPSAFGGALPAILSFLAQARAVTWLDDDDWYAVNHLSTLYAALGSHAWAYSLSWYVEPWNFRPLCIDRLESVGPNAGYHAETFGGFVRMQCVMIDKLRCQPALHLWAQARVPRGEGSDRVVFAALREHMPDWSETGSATVYCLIKPSDEMHPARIAWLREQGVDVAVFETDQPFAAPRV